MSYTNSLNAEFAKEAMSNQSLDNNEVSESNKMKLVYYILCII